MAYPSLTAVVHQDVKNAPSGKTAREIAHLLGIKYNTLMSELSLQQGHKLGADMLLPLMHLTHSDSALHVMARNMGGMFICMPKSAEGTLLAQTALQSVKEFGDFAAEMTSNISDGIVTRAELARIEKEGQEAATAIMSFLELARQVHAEQFS